MGKKNPSKSIVQDELASKIGDWLPYAYIEQEVYLGDLIDESPYTRKEISKELGHDVRRQFVDIVIRESDRIVAVEYHGEQHYTQVGHMTASESSLLFEQQRDREKSWILQRIGIPLVAVPFDMYIDHDVFESMVDDADREIDAAFSQFSVCPSCNRAFPANRIKVDVCDSCDEKRQELISSHTDNDGGWGKPTPTRTSRSKKPRKSEERRKNKVRPFADSGDDIEEKNPPLPDFAARKRAKEERKAAENTSAPEDDAEILAAANLTVEISKEKRKAPEPEPSKRRFKLPEEMDGAESYPGSHEDDVIPDADVDEGIADDRPCRKSRHDGESEEDRKKRLAEAREARRAAYRAYKDTDEYKQRAEEQRELRREIARQHREDRKKGR